MTTLETALEKTRYPDFAARIFERLEGCHYTDAEFVRTVIPALGREFAVPALTVGLLVAEFEWDGRGGWWIDALEDGTNTFEWVCALFTARYGGSLKDWEEYVMSVLEDRTAE